MVSKTYTERYNTDENFRKSERERQKKLYWSNVEESRRKCREKRKRLYHQDIEKHREQARDFYWENIEKNREQNRLQAKKHSHKRVVTNRVRRWTKRKEIFEKLGGKCVECGFSNPLALTFHHINGKDRRYDWLKNGYDYSNLKLLCHNCHNILHISENMKGIP